MMYALSVNAMGKKVSVPFYVDIHSAQRVIGRAGFEDADEFMLYLQFALKEYPEFVQKLSSLRIGVMIHPKTEKKVVVKMSLLIPGRGEDDDSDEIVYLMLKIKEQCIRVDSIILEKDESRHHAIGFDSDDLRFTLENGIVENYIMGVGTKPEAPTRTAFF